MLTTLFQGIIDGIGGLLNVFNVLPTSPFLSINAVTIDNRILGMLSWLVPFDAIIALLNAWLTAITIFYISKKALRWMKMIQ